MAFAFRLILVLAFAFSMIIILTMLRLAAKRQVALFQSVEPGRAGLDPEALGHCTPSLLPLGFISP